MIDGLNIHLDAGRAPGKTYRQCVAHVWVQAVQREQKAQAHAIANMYPYVQTFACVRSNAPIPAMHSSSYAAACMHSYVHILA